MKNNKGFTLIELLVVVLIIGILAAIALPQYTRTVEKSRSAEAIINLKAMADAANRHYLLKSSYTGAEKANLDVDTPTSNANFVFSDGASCNGTTCSYKACRGTACDATAKYTITFTVENGTLKSRTCSNGTDTTTCGAINAMLGNNS